MKVFSIVWFLNLFLTIASAEIFPVHDAKDVLQSGQNPRLEQIAQATVALLRTDDDNFLNPKTFGDVYKFCSQESFLDQKLFSYCSGTLIEKNKILTAGHCVRDLKDCKAIRVAFDYFGNSDVDRIKSHKILKCKKITAWSKPVSQTQLVDYAVIELDKPVLDRKPIVMNIHSRLQDRLFSMGHPLGLPMKLVQGFISSEDVQVNQSKPDSSYTSAHMNSHPGLSGSGVYNQQFELAGILVRGEANIERDGFCSRLRSCETQDCPWVQIQKLPKLQ